MGLKLEHHYPLHHPHDFASDHIVEMTGDNHSPDDSPPHEFTSTFDFPSPLYTQSDSMYSSAPYQTSYSAPQPLHPLNTATLWPSQLTNPSGSSPPQMLPLQPRPLAPITQDAPATPAKEPTPPPAKPTHTLPTSRKTLTDNDRRRMCKYHEENPTVKQTEIGGKSLAFQRRKYVLTNPTQRCLGLSGGSFACDAMSLLTAEIFCLVLSQKSYETKRNIL